MSSSSLERMMRIIPFSSIATFVRYPLCDAAIQRFSAAHPRLTNSSRLLGSTTGNDLVKSGRISISVSPVLNSHGCVLCPEGAFTACSIMNRKSVFCANIRFIIPKNKTMNTIFLIVVHVSSINQSSGRFLARPAPIPCRSANRCRYTRPSVLPSRPDS